MASKYLKKFRSRSIGAALEAGRFNSRPSRDRKSAQAYRADRNIGRGRSHDALISTRPYGECRGGYVYI